MPAFGHTPKYLHENQQTGRLLAFAALACSALAAVSACGAAAGQNVERASNKQETIVPVDSAAEIRKSEHLRVIAMTITAGDQAIFIKSDGTVETKVDGAETRVATLRRTGEMLHNNGGLLVTLNPDGTLIGAFVQSESFDGLVISPDGNTSQAGAELMTVSPEGGILRDGEVIAMISGPVDGRQAAMFVFLLANIQAELAAARPNEGTSPDDSAQSPEADENRAP